MDLRVAFAVCTEITELLKFLMLWQSVTARILCNTFQKWSKSKPEISESQPQNPCHPLGKHHEIGSLSLSFLPGLRKRTQFHSKVDPFKQEKDLSLCIQSEGETAWKRSTLVASGDQKETRQQGIKVKNRETNTQTRMRNMGTVSSGSTRGEGEGRSRAEEGSRLVSHLWTGRRREAARRRPPRKRFAATGSTQRASGEVKKVEGDGVMERGGGGRRARERGE